MTDVCKPDAVVTMQPFNAQIAIFRDQKTQRKYFKKAHGIKHLNSFNGTANGTAMQLTSPNGFEFYTMFLPVDVTAKTVVHECSHIVDFVLDSSGVPLIAENTEIRAYALADLFEQVTNALSAEGKK